MLLQKRLIGMLHAPPLPGSPRNVLPIHEIEAHVLADASAMQAAGFEAFLLENFGDAPFHKEQLEPVTLAALTRLAVAVRRDFPAASLGLNALRNDAAAAIAVATVVGAQFVRVNVHVGVTATDQGLIEGRAAETVRLRRALGSLVEIWADVHVKHGRNLSHPTIEAEAEDAVRRGLADALVVSGTGTGQPVAPDDLRRVARLQLGVPVYAGSGVGLENLESVLQHADGAIVGTSLKQQGETERPVDPERARRFVQVLSRSAGQ